MVKFPLACVVALRVERIKGHSAERVDEFHAEVLSRPCISDCVNKSEIAAP